MDSEVKKQAAAIIERFPLLYKLALTRPMESAYGKELLHVF
jgi:hypothetical protein